MKTKQAKEKPVSRRLDKQVQKIVNTLYLETVCAGGCGRRMSIDDMTADAATGQSICDDCYAGHFGHALAVSHAV